MSKWYVKDLSKLSGTSVQSLHYYDRIGLLKPSARLENGYRLYTAKDLEKLQQVMALKFFGFNLAQVKTVLASNTETRDMLERQAHILGEKARAFQAASDSLTSLVAETPTHHPMPWQTIIQTIEVYKMVKKLENTWAYDVLTSDELNEYAAVEANWEAACQKKPQKMQMYIKQHASLMAQVKEHFDMGPKSDVGYKIAEEWMAMINGIYTDEYTNLKLAIWEKGFKPGKVTGDWAIDAEVFPWLDEAIDHYYYQRIRAQLANISNIDVKASGVPKAWTLLMRDICGDSLETRASVYGKIMADPATAETVKKWLEQVRHLEK